MAVRAPAGRGLSPLIPLGYFACAEAAFVAGALGTAWLAPELAGHYYHPQVLALTHTITLGWITMAIMGATYQLVPVVLERPIWSERIARWQLGIVAVAVTGMVAHFYLGTWPGLAAATAMLAAGIGLYLLNLAVTFRGLGRGFGGSSLRLFTPWTATARLMAMGFAGLALTTLFGLSLAANHLVRFLPGEFFPTVHAHLHLALLGWVTPMMLGVSARVYPMFLLAPATDPWTARLQVWAVALGVPALVLGLLGVPGLTLIGTLAVAAAALVHGSWVIRMVRARQRPDLDWGLRFTITATAFLAPSAGTNRKTTLTIQSSLTFQADGTYTCTFKARNNTARTDNVTASGVTINGGARINLIGTVQGELQIGLAFTISSNTSANPIAGTFSNLPDGGIVTIGGNNFQASYEGGDGNDLTLTVVP